MAKRTLTAKAEAGRTFLLTEDLEDGYREARDRFFEDLGRNADGIPAHYPPFTEEHAEVLFVLGYLD